MPTVDVHAHCIPETLIELLRSDGSRFGIEIVDGDRGPSARLSDGSVIGPFRTALTDTGARTRSMDSAGIDVQLISSWIDLTAYALPAAEGAAYARAFNEVMAEEAARRPDRFIPLGTVPLQDPSAAAEELRHAVEQLGMAGVEIATTVGPVDLDRAGLEPFWEAAASLRCLILIHPCDPLSGVDLGRHFLDNMVGRPAETSIAVAHLLFSGVLERHPDLVACVVHGGGFVPYQLGRMQRGFEAVPHLAASDISSSPSELARRLYYDTVLHDPAALRFLVDRVGSDRVVLGTDYPFEMGDHDPITSLDAVPGLPEDDRALIVEGNVRRILDGIVRA